METVLRASIFSDWTRFVMHDDILYRVWESADGLHTAKQMIVPRCMIDEMCKVVHDVKSYFRHWITNLNINKIQLL